MDSYDLKKTEMLDLVNEPLEAGKAIIVAITSNSSCSSSDESDCSISPKGEDLMDSKKTTTISSVTAEETGREKLKRHRREMAGRVWIPETWGQESLLDDWKDCNVIDRWLYPTGLLSARDALVEDCRKVNSGRVRIRNSC